VSGDAQDYALVGPVFEVWRFDGDGVASFGEVCDQIFADRVSGDAAADAGFRGEDFDFGVGDECACLVFDGAGDGACACDLGEGGGSQWEYGGEDEELAE